MVDIQNNKGGGIEEALQVIKEWHQMYNLYHWVIEENNFQKLYDKTHVLKNMQIEMELF